MYTLNKCCITSPFSLSLLCLSASSTGCFSFPAPSHFPQKFAKTKKKKFSAHILLSPKGHKICSSAANRKPLKDSAICRSGRGVMLLGSQQTNEKAAFEGSVARRGSEVACAGRGRNGN